MGSWRSRATQSDAKGVHSQGPGSGSPGQSPARERQFRNMVAEREGFEPSVHLLGVHTISSRAPSASRTSLPNNLFILHDDPPGTGSHSLWPLFARGGAHRRRPGGGSTMAERVGFEPTCPALHRTSRFRVDPVTATSVPLHSFRAFLPGVG